MPAAQQRNHELVQLLSADFLPIGDRNAAFEAYDAVGNTFTTVEAQVFNTTRVNTAPSIFDFDGSVLTITQAGFYQLGFHAVVVNVGESAVAEAGVFVEQDPATGTFQAVPALFADIFVPASGRNSGGGMAILRVGENYRYRVRVVRNSGVDQLGLVNNGSMFSAIRLFALR